MTIEEGNPLIANQGKVFPITAITRDHPITAIS
jgi:hypothetical protein